MPHDVFTIDDFDFDLPQELIAQHPAPGRDQSRLFVLDRKTSTHVHTVFSSLPSFLREGDLMVFNDARVINARLQCVKPTGGTFEIFLTRKIDDLHWRAIASRMKRLRPGDRVKTIGEISLEIIITGRVWDEIEIETREALTDELLTRVGAMALPPYIRREASEEDTRRYQTVYARSTGAVAAPTAGLHFTEGLLETIRRMGVETCFITLNVSWGTFQPVRVHDIREHAMHRETYTLEEPIATRINSAREAGRRIIAVGTTSLRVLETTFHEGINRPGTGETDIFIYPPQTVRSADCLITNFHTPRSTLLMLVSAFAGYDTIMEAYREAVSLNYRFFSYGDAMFIR
jgi:S-adenosylmethionine:tRNA ribosyltransferase-isomerase